MPCHCSKFHCQLVGPFLERSVNVTTSPPKPDAAVWPNPLVGEPTKSAIGATTIGPPPPGTSATAPSFDRIGRRSLRR